LTKIVMFCVVCNCHFTSIIAQETNKGTNMIFGKRRAPGDDPSLTKAVSDAAAVGVSRDKIQTIINGFQEGSRTVDDVKATIEQIGSLKARFLANDADEGNLTVEPKGEASLVPNHQTYELFNERHSVPLSSDIAAEFTSHTQKTTVPEDLEFQHPVSISSADTQSRNQSEFSTCDRRNASEALTQSQLDNVEQTGNQLRAVTFSEMLSDVDELVPGLIEKGVSTMLYGLNGGHNSHLALQLGLCIQAGLEVFGTQSVQASFVYLDYENGKAEVARRVRIINSRLGLSSLSNSYYHDFRTPQNPLGTVRPQETARPLAIVSDKVHLEPFYYDLCKYLRTIPGHKFVVVDSTNDFLRFADQAETSETAVKEAFTVLDDLCAATDTTMLHLLHSFPSEKNNWSWILENMAPARLNIKKLDNTKDAIVLRVERRRGSTAGRTVTLHWSDGILLEFVDQDAGEMNELLFETCVQFACTAAKTGSPIQRLTDFAEWQLDEIESKAGVRPSQRKVKEQLEIAIDAGRLRYVKDGGRLSGFYSAETHPEILDTIDASADQPTGDPLQDKRLLISGDE